MGLLTPEQFAGFLAASLLITATPGPDNLLVLSLGASRGQRAGMVFGLGCATGCISHTVLAALGVSALIAASPWAFATLKVLGGLYLVYLGWQALRSSGNLAVQGDGDVSPSLTGLFAKGLLANAVNPKVVLFFLAFLPQFVDADRGDTPWQIVQLGLVFTLQAALLFGLLGFFAGSIGQWLQRHGRAGLWLDRMTGTVFVALGLRMIFAR